MQGCAGLLGVFHGGFQHVVLKELAVTDGLGDAGQLLIDHAAGADVGVADLTVAHLAVGQAHVHAGSTDLGVGIGGKQLVQVGGACGVDGVGAGVVAAAKTIHNAKHYRFHNARFLLEYTG